MVPETNTRGNTLIRATVSATVILFLVCLVYNTYNISSISKDVSRIHGEIISKGQQSLSISGSILPDGTLVE